ncbi:MAG: hypothetical protein Q9195_005570 [Heterodermia aff. obscurata]
MKDRISGDDGRQNKNASLATSSKNIGKRTSQIKDINTRLAQNTMGDHKEGSGSSGSTSAGSGSTGKNSGSENPISDPGSTRPTTPTRSPRSSQVISPSRVPASASTFSTPESATTPADRLALSSSATEKPPSIYSANKLETSAMTKLTIYNPKERSVATISKDCIRSPISRA